MTFSSWKVRVLYPSDQKDAEVQKKWGWSKLGTSQPRFIWKDNHPTQGSPGRTTGQPSFTWKDNEPTQFHLEGWPLSLCVCVCVRCDYGPRHDRWVTSWLNVCYHPSRLSSVRLKRRQALPLSSLHTWPSSLDTRLAVSVHLENLYFIWWTNVCCLLLLFIIMPTWNTDTETKRYIADSLSTTTNMAIKALQ